MWWIWILAGIVGYIIWLVVCTVVVTKWKDSLGKMKYEELPKMFKTVFVVTVVSWLPIIVPVCSIMWLMGYRAKDLK